MPLHEVILTRIGETKRTVVYGILTADGKRPSPDEFPVNALYVGKRVLNGTPPQNIRVTIEAAAI